MSKALDYATRKAVADTVRDTLRDEYRSLSLAVDRVPVPQLHGPESIGCELFVIGCALIGVVSPADVPLQRSDFWAQLHGRVWQTMLATGYRYTADRSLEAQLLELASQAVASGLIGGAPEAYMTQFWLWADMSADRVALRDVAGAIATVREHARSRRLVALLARLADGICAKSETHDSAYGELRDYFAADRISESEHLTALSLPTEK